jgi:cell division protein FtsB
MRYLWSRLIIIFLAIEGVGFILYYNFGPRGIQTLRVLKKTKMAAQSDIEKIKSENADLKDQIEEWKSDLFLQEKFAREKLSLQKEGEIIYFR